MNTDIRELLDKWNKNISDDEYMNTFMYGDLRINNDMNANVNKQSQNVMNDIQNQYVENSNELNTIGEKMKYNVIYDVDPEYDLSNVDVESIQYEYKIQSILETSEIEFSKNTRIHIVPFVFMKCRDKHPFLAYLSYLQDSKSIDVKDSDNDSKDNNNKQNEKTFVFPHITLEQYQDMFKNNENEKMNIQTCSDMYFKKLFNKQMKTIGYLKHDEFSEYFMFYDLTNKIDDLVFKEYRRTYNWKWISTGDILYSGKVMFYDIHTNIISLFRKRKELIYVYLNDKYYMLPLTLYTVSEIEGDNNFKYPISRSKDENTTFMYDFFTMDAIMNKFKDSEIHIGRYFVFFRKVFISNKFISIIETEEGTTHFDNFDCIIDNVDGKGIYQIKSNEQFMFIDSNFYSYNNTNE